MYLLPTRFHSNSAQRKKTQAHTHTNQTAAHLFATHQQMPTTSNYSRIHSIFEIDRTLAHTVRARETTVRWEFDSSIHLWHIIPRCSAKTFEIAENASFTVASNSLLSRWALSLARSLPLPLSPFLLAHIVASRNNFIGVVLLSTDEYALFVSQYIVNPWRTHNDISLCFFIILNQSRFMHLIFNNIQKDMLAYIAIFMLPITATRSWLDILLHSNKMKNMTPNIVNVLWDLFETAWMERRKEGNCSFC